MATQPAPMTALRSGRYVLVGTLGHGAQGTTWDAVDKREGRAVAVKAFDVRGARTWKDVELAEREARVLAELEHPALPRYIEHFEEGGVLYLVMEKVEGTALSARLRPRRPMQEAEVARFLDEASEVLRYLHGRSPPIIHRDIKPGNVLERPDGSFAIVDFGAVRDKLRPEGGSTVVGTFGYMAPEQFQGRAGPASDVYSVGATAIAMLTGQEPENLPHRGLSLDVEAALAGRASPEVRAVLAQMLEPDPDRRPSSMDDLLGGLPRRRASRRVDVRREEDRPLSGDTDADLGAAVRALVFAALVVGQAAVSLTLRVLVPAILHVLAIAFGPRLRTAADDVRLAADRVEDAFARALRQVGHEGRGAPEARVRVEAPKRKRGRRTGPVQAPIDGEEAATEEPAREPRRKGRGRIE